MCCEPSTDEARSVFLTYLDDGGKGAIKVFGGVVFNADEFDSIETKSGMIAARLLPPERRADFEFHASDLFAATGAFAGVDKDRCHDALLEFVQVPFWSRATYVYSAVDMARLQKGPVRSARWIDLAFFMCACEIENLLTLDARLAMERWRASPDPKRPLTRDVFRPLNLTILDEPEQGDKDRHRIRSTFRELRGLPTRVMLPRDQEGTSFTYSSRLWHSVDDVFFGSSENSIGLQVADVCNWVMWRKLLYGIQDKFYEELMRARVVCATPEPEWTEHRHLFKSHDDA